MIRPSPCGGGAAASVDGMGWTAITAYVPMKTQSAGLIEPACASEYFESLGMWKPP